MKNIISVKNQYGTYTAARLLRSHGVSLKAALLLAKNTTKN